MTLNGVMVLFCIISANSGSFRANCVKVHVRCLISWWVLVKNCWRVCIIVYNCCTQHSRAVENSSDNLPSHPPDSHYCSVAVFREGRGDKCGCNCKCWCHCLYLYGGFRHYFADWLDFDMWLSCDIVVRVWFYCWVLVKFLRLYDILMMMC